MPEPIVTITLDTATTPPKLMLNPTGVAVNSDSQIVFRNETNLQVSIYNNENGHLLQHLPAEPQANHTVTLVDLSFVTPYLLLTAPSSDWAYLPCLNVVVASTQTNSSGQDELVAEIANNPMSSADATTIGTRGNASPSCPNAAGASPRIWIANQSSAPVTVGKFVREQPIEPLGPPVATNGVGGFDVATGDEVQLGNESSTGPGRVLPKITIDDPDCGDEVR